MKKPLTFTERGHLNLNLTAKKLFSLMDEKQSNLCLAADVTSQKELLDLANELGPQICVLKTHVDILSDYNSSFGTKIREIAEKHRFLIFEDRKFADIGNTLKMQYEGGIYKIVDWADIVNMHPFVGPFGIEALKSVGKPQNRALLLITEMSAKGTLGNKDTQKKGVEFAKTYQDFVIGFISQRRMTKDPAFLHLTPGIKLTKGKDNLGQQYNDPETAIIKHGTDIVIVGRGIIQAKNRKEMAQTYLERAWNAHLKQLTY